MPTSDLALAQSSAATTNTSLLTLLTRCANVPECLRHLSKAVSHARLHEWLRATRVPSQIPVWVWLSYPNGVPRWVTLNLRALRLHAPAPHFRIIVLNASTVSQWLPLPPEFSRLRSPVAASDLARLGLLATYGVLYLDADVLVASPLRPIVRLLDEYEIVAYTAPGQDCRAGVFSSNFLATRPNSTLWARAYASLLAQLRSRCGGRGRRRVCCYAQNATPITCRSPWGLTDWVMRPAAMALAAEIALSVHCLGHFEGLTPMAFAHPERFTPAEAGCLGYLHIYTAPYRANIVRGGGGRRLGEDASAPPRASTQGGDPDDDLSRAGFFCGKCVSHHPREGPNSTLCCRRRGNALECRNSRGHYAKAGNFFNRVAYHLFESINGAELTRNEPVEKSDLAVATLYQRALGLEQGRPRRRLNTRG